MVEADKTFVTLETQKKVQWQEESHCSKGKNDINSEILLTEACEHLPLFHTSKPNSG